MDKNSYLIRMKGVFIRNYKYYSQNYDDLKIYNNNFSKSLKKNYR